MSQLDLVDHADQLDLAFRALEQDLLAEGGPQISTIRNHRFAILPYPPSKEFQVRRRTRRLARTLDAHGWILKTISLRGLLLDRLARRGGDYAERIIALEAQLGRHNRARAQAWLGATLGKEIEGPDGLAGECAAVINAFLQETPVADRERLVCVIGCAGPLYPYFRFSALLRYLDGHTSQVQVVLLYPGARKGDAGLSFMGELAPDRDYRPRIYP